MQCSTKCPKCQSPEFSPCGWFTRKSDSKKIRRFRCNGCKKTFSTATFDPCYRQRKRKKNHMVKNLLCSGVSQRRAAMILNLNRKTIERKLKFLARMARLEQNEFLENSEFMEIELDDLITSEHTKCKPLSVTVIVQSKTRTILALEVSSMPAFGHLAAISREKYGYRPDHRKRGIRSVLTKIQKRVSKNAIIKTDDHRFYPPEIKELLPHAHHVNYLGAKSTIAGQGELKKLIRDPLFSINHTLAMLRANINRLIRRTWCTTKKASALQDHLDLYVSFHNQQLI